MKWWINDFRVKGPRTDFNCVSSGIKNPETIKLNPSHANRQADRKTDGRIDGRTDGWTGWLAGWLAGWLTD